MKVRELVAELLRMNPEHEVSLYVDPSDCMDDEFCGWNELDGAVDEGGKVTLTLRHV